MAFEELNLGCLQRIADATEKMASSYTNMEAERNRYRQWYQDKRDECERLAKTVIGLRGQLAKQVKRARNAEASGTNLDRGTTEAASSS